MIFAQILLIIAVIATMALGLRSYSSRTQALTTIAFFVFAILAIAAVIFPAWTTKLANLIGIGRGADLVLYCLVIFVMFRTINDSIHQRRERQRFAKLVRHIVLMETEVPVTPQPKQSETQDTDTSK